MARPSQPWGGGLPTGQPGPEGDLASTNRALTQDPGDGSQWPRDMASMALLSQDAMFQRLETVGRPCGCGRGGHGVRNLV